MNIPVLHYCWHYKLHYLTGRIWMIKHRSSNQWCCLRAWISKATRKELI
ncbi:hypothetical protein PVAP13_3NG115384 [Panicum virgatum]|uniref:Uncharacterized protein n=1 Tax=Panicum virgatum TaxID=38727 RepID=A0A8T0U239_PANVG|nr:hypothetical protein PVAP13_3NG115384 [Panicum virgatum]